MEWIALDLRLPRITLSNWDGDLQYKWLALPHCRELALDN